MTVPFLILIIALVFIIFFYKDFHAFVYFVVIVDIFLRVVTYLKLNILKTGAFSFLDVIPSDVPAIINDFDMGVLNEILMAVYIIVYIIFEVFAITKFIRRKF